MKKILIIIPHLAGGGAEHVAASLSKYFPRGVETVYALFEDRVEYSHAGRVVSLDLPSEDGALKKIANIAGRYFRLKKLMAAENPDAVLSFMESSNLLNVMCNPGRAVVSVRAHTSINYKNDFFNRMIVRSYNLAGKVIAVSEEIKKDLAGNFGVAPAKIEVIYNPAGVDEVERCVREPITGEHAALFADGKTIIACGRMNDQKNHASLIRAFKMALPHLGGARLVILGRGERENDLKRLVSELGLAGRVHFPGFQKNPHKFVKASRLFVLSSLYEGFPNSIVEAMICRTPVVSSRCPSGPAEIFAGAPFCNLFEPGDDAALASKMITFYKRDNSDMLEFYKKKLVELDCGVIASKYLAACGIGFSAKGGAGDGGN